MSVGGEKCADFIWRGLWQVHCIPKGYFELPCINNKTF